MKAESKRTAGARPGRRAFFRPLAPIFPLALTLALALVAATDGASAQTAFSLGSSQVDDARAIAVDAAGNRYITGRFRLTIDFDPGPAVANLTSPAGFSNYVASYDADGALRYAFSFSGGSSIADRGIAVDAASNVYVTGAFSGVVDFDPGPGVTTLSSGNGILFLASYDPDGDFRWAFNLNGDEPSFSEAGTAIAADAAGNLYLTGEFSGETDFDPTAGQTLVEANGITDAFLASYDTNGGIRFAIGFGGIARDRGLDIAIDGSGNSFVTGSFRETVDFDPGPGVVSLVSAGNRDFFLASYTDGGAIRYAVSAGDTAIDIGYGVAVDASGNAFVTGVFAGSADFDPGPGETTLVSVGNSDIFLASYSATGALRFAYGFGALNGGQAFDAELDAAGNVYITGSIPNAVDFDPGPGVALIDPSGTDAYVASYSGAGVFREAYSFESTATGLAVGYGLAIDGGRVSVTGTLDGSGSVDFDPGPGTVPLSTVGSTDIFLSDLGPGSPVPALAPLGLAFVVGLLGWLGWRNARSE